MIQVQYAHRRWHTGLSHTGCKNQFRRAKSSILQPERERSERLGPERTKTLLRSVMTNKGVKRWRGGGGTHSMYTQPKCTSAYPYDGWKEQGRAGGIRRPTTGRTYRRRINTRGSDALGPCSPPSRRSGRPTCQVRSPPNKWAARNFGAHLTSWPPETLGRRTVCVCESSPKNTRLD